MFRSLFLHVGARMCYLFIPTVFLALRKPVFVRLASTRFTFHALLKED
jgi:hypothetical protein